MYKRSLLFLGFGGRGVIHVTVEKEKIHVTYNQSYARIFVIYLFGFIFISSILSGGVVPTVETLLFIFLFFCVALSISIFSRIISLAMFITNVFDAFMKK